MTQKDQFIKILDDAHVDYGYSEGDCILITGLGKFRFGVSGSFIEAIPENGGDDDY